MATRDALIVTVLIFNILFPTVAYAFTTLADEGTTIDSSIIDPDTLLLAGINVANSTTHTVEWENGWVEYAQEDATYRLRWANDQGFGALFDNGPGFALEKRTNPIDRVFGTWLFPLHLKFENTTGGHAGDEIASNSTVVDQYNEEYGWAKLGLEKSSMVLLFTQNTTISPTFEDAIMVNGTVIVTLCTVVSDDFSLGGLIDFFAGTLLGDNLYGMPTIFAWVMRLITGLSVLALAWFIKDMTQV